MIGLSTYGYTWRMAESADQPMTVLDLVGETRQARTSPDLHVTPRNHDDHP